MQAVRVKGVANPMQFPDDMDIEDIKAFLQKRFANMAASGESTVDVSPRQATAQAYKPTLQERFSQGIGNTLTSTGLVDDNYQAQNIGKNIGNIAAFSPVGSAFGGDEFGKALKEDDKLGMALGALEGVGVGGDIAKLAIFGGIMAKGADLKALAKAKKLETSGADRDEIWKETGWANDKGDWKFEISDMDAVESNIRNQVTLLKELRKKPDLDSRNKAKELEISLSRGLSDQSDILKHDELYNSYDDLKNVKTQATSTEGAGEQGAYDKEGFAGKELIQYSMDGQKSVNLHELQHAIQNREGFAGGGSPDEFLTSPRMKQLDKEIARMESSPNYDYDKIQELMREKARLLVELPSPHEQYQRLAGEAEARNVQTRMDWTPEQRRETPPWKTLDVPEDELIYRKSGGESLSANDALGGVTLSRSDKVTNQYGDSITAMDIISEGKPVGSIEYLDDVDSITILRSDVEDKFAGKGVGTNAYEQLITKALAEGKTVKSDAIVSKQAQRVYEKLKAKGLNITEADGLGNLRRGEKTTIPREERLAQTFAAPVKTLPDGTRTSGQFRMKGDPVYTIEP